jgi:hypothetical protein
MSVRMRKWTTAKGEAKEAWVVNYTDGSGVRRMKTFERVSRRQQGRRQDKRRQDKLAVTWRFRATGQA